MSENMQHYLNQLLEDLRQVAEHPPQAPYIEVPPHLNENVEIAELALTPYKTIEEWTGIGVEAFPDVIDLRGGQWEQMNKAIFKVFDALNIQLIDLPEGIPHDTIYEVLTTNWDTPVQYLPNAGFDLEFCTFDPQTCPYGEYCDCGSMEEEDEEDDEEEDEEDEDEIPFISGLYNDDGTRVVIENIPIPGLCLRCKSYLVDDWEENLLCNMNRNDQQNDDHFECGAFEEEEPRIPEN